MHSRVVIKQQTVEKWKIANYAEEERKSLEGEIIRKVRVTVSNVPPAADNRLRLCPLCSSTVEAQVVGENSMLDRAPIDLQQGPRPAERNARCLRAAHFFFLSLLCEDG